MDDDLDFESDGELEYASTSRRRLGKRPMREVDYEFDDNTEEIEDELVRDRARPGNNSSRRDQENDDQQDEDVKPTFRPETLQAIFKTVWTDPGTKSQKDALQLSAEYLRLFTIEALHRTAAYQREQEDEELRNEETLIELDSLEAITPQLVMDF
ncbi:hypothetical protein BGZ76_004263 [Entomortierella beljakovae]|nr:hypothetical protein BGZ76_004263 [Entomortierella beljakovae]